MSELIRSRKEYGRPIFVAFATMLILLFVAVVVLSSANDTSISAIRQASTIVFFVAWFVGGGVYALQGKKAQKTRQAPRQRVSGTPATGNLAATRS